MAQSDLITSTPIVRSKKPRVGSNVCPMCDVEIRDGVDYMPCSVCELCFCTMCCKINPALLFALKEDKGQNLKWTCNSCKQNFPCMTGLRNELKLIGEQTSSRLSAVEKNLAMIDTNIKDKVKDEVSAMKSDIVCNIHKEIEEKLQDSVRKEVREIEDQKSRVLNLICFNLKESESKESEVRKSHDVGKFRELCGLLGVKDIDIKLCFRLGNRRNGTCRPLKVIMNNKKHPNRKEFKCNTNKIPMQY